MLFSAQAHFSIGDPLEYVITLPSALEAGNVRIRCLGKVVRFSNSEVAATLERYEFVRNGASGSAIF